MTDVPKCPLHGLTMVEAGLSDEDPDQRPRQLFRCTRNGCGITISRPQNPQNPTANLQSLTEPK